MSDKENSGIDRATAEKERGLLDMDYATPCPKCGGVVFEWWDSDTCRDCEDSNDGTSSEQTTLLAATDGGEMTAKTSTGTDQSENANVPDGDTDE